MDEVEKKISSKWEEIDQYKKTKNVKPTNTKTKHPENLGHYEKTKPTNNRYRRKLSVDQRGLIGVSKQPRMLPRLVAHYKLTERPNYWRQHLHNS